MGRPRKNPLPDGAEPKAPKAPKAPKEPKAPKSTLAPKEVKVAKEPAISRPPRMRAPNGTFVAISASPYVAPQRQTSKFSEFISRIAPM